MRQRWVIGLLGLLCAAGCLGQNEPVSRDGQPKVQGAAPPPIGPPPPPIEPDYNPDYPRGGSFEISESEKGDKLKERVKAEVGVGVKGRRLEDERLVKTIVTPAVSLFRTRERVVFTVQIPKAMQLYEATNGKKPQTEEEYFSQIIEANKIPLPELPEGERYIYDPKTGELLVERPAR